MGKLTDYILHIKAHSMAAFWHLMHGFFPKINNKQWKWEEAQKKPIKDIRIEIK